MTDITHIEQIITRALLESCDNHKTRAQIARETARQVMEVAQAGVTLKPLDWNLRGDGCHEAVTSMGRYMIFPGTGFSYELCGPVGGRLSIHKRLDDAKAGGQSDYEQRIRSCIITSPSYEDGLKEGLRRAARKATSFLVGDPANGVPLRNPMAHEVATAILALLTKEEGR